MSISLSAEMKAFVDAQVASGAYNNCSEVVRDLIRKERRREAQARVEELLLEGIRSGPPREMTERDWADLAGGPRKRKALRARTQSKPRS
jgi:antitoxin ParD1/3/4